jgi:hypothetical protein
LFFQDLDLGEALSAEAKLRPTEEGGKHPPEAQKIRFIRQMVPPAMEVVDSGLVVGHVSGSVGLAFHGLDPVLDSLYEAGSDPVGELAETPVAVRGSWRVSRVGGRLFQACIRRPAWRHSNRSAMLVFSCVPTVRPFPSTA